MISPVFNDKSLTHLRYSFSKSERFRVPKSYCNQQYKMPEEKSNRQATMGSGERSLFKDIPNVPGPGNYTKELIQPLNKLQGKTIGLSRDQVKANSYIPKKFTQVGPGQHLKKLSTLALKSFVLSDRPKSKSKDKTPGPGNYKQPSYMSSKGKFALSQVENSQIFIFNPPSSLRFIDVKQKNRTPGVGEYSQDLQNPKGHVILSEYKTSVKNSFKNEKRDVFKVLNFSPGPGKYEVESSFKK